MKRLLKQENILYMALWTFMFIVPVIMLFSQREHGESFDWADLLHIWKQLAVYLLVFIFHNLVLAPMLIEKHRLWKYISAVVMLVALFFVVQCMNRPAEPGPPSHAIHEMPQGERPPLPPPHEDGFDEGPRPMVRPLVGQHDIVATIILMLMLGMNIGVKLYFRHQEDHRRMTDLEHQNLEQQLEYLKYQINPHFLMNTLNNIHALVDIDPEQAKDTIVGLSKIMRYVLYESSMQKVPIIRELCFIDDYIQLMRMRVTETVSVNVEMPEHTPDGQIPPLMLITFVENAFKHGVSYQKPSFIDISITTSDNRLHFTCRNSKVLRNKDLHGGIGLANTKRRLELIYGTDYELSLDDQADTYTVTLDIPV